MEEEIFKNFEFDGMHYKIGNFGTIYGVRFKDKPLKQRLNRDGYLMVTLGREKGKRTAFPVHRLVALLFVPNPNGYPEVNHKDYNRANPRYDNLEWVTHKDNVTYSSCEGRYKGNVNGSKNGRATFVEKDVIEIRRLYYEEGYKICEIVKMFNSKWSTINNIITRNTWKHVQ